ncbi:unnamed protein product [Hydatigera taeniaeformis]|uniref:SRCR domain-containing protein n=1 Tax=Hydatigena taeniaeformis TaxID=6205 RepID=A0A0R3X077_HYDTA|nr:unnamed protein product [Hydatigera taeniaeformis]
MNQRHLTIGVHGSWRCAFSWEVDEELHRVRMGFVEWSCQMNRLHQCTTQPTEEDNMRESETVRVDGMRWVMEWMHRGVEQRWCIIESPQKLQCCCNVMEDRCWTLERLR